MSDIEYFMVVDDDPSNNIICKFSILKICKGANIKLFTEPEAALSHILEAYHQLVTPTLLFLDINMPSMSGWDFLEAFKLFPVEITKQFTIYILSSSIDERDKEIAEKNKFVSGFISKPLNRDSLAAIIQQLHISCG